MVMLAKSVYNFFSMLKLPYPTKQKGFTLIELLIVIMIIAVLAGLILSVLNSQGIRGKARDSQRIADLKKMQASLELYFSDNRQYPNPGSGNWVIIDGADGLSAALEAGYISDVPVDPIHVGGNTGPCNTPERNRYNYWSDGDTYVLSAVMEIETSNTDHECENLNNWSGWCGGVPSTICYGVENP
jgi:general secretion pathway protein G